MLVLLIWLIVWIVRKCRRNGHVQIPSIENPILRTPNREVDPDHVAEAFLDNGMSKINILVSCISRQDLGVIITCTNDGTKLGWFASIRFKFFVEGIEIHMV